MRQRRTVPRVRRQTLGLTVLAILLGVYITAQWQSKPRPAASSPEYRREIAATTIQRLEAEQADLKRLIADLRPTLATQRQAAASGERELADLTQAIDEERLLAGAVAVRGPGVRVVVDDSATKSIPAKDDPALYIVHEYQLRDIVNSLWAAGAEAISVNDERIVSPTSIYCVGSTILVNDTRTSPPYEFIVIGDQARIEGALADSTALKSLKNRVRAYGLQFSYQRIRGDATVSAFSGSFDIRYARADATGVTAPSMTQVTAVPK